MSIKVTQQTDYAADPQEVNHRMWYARIQGTDEAGFPNLTIGLGFRGRFDDTTGIVEQRDAPSLNRADVIDNFSAEEKDAGRLFLAAIEREGRKGLADLAEAEHDATDVLT